VIIGAATGWNDGAGHDSHGRGRGVGYESYAQGYGYGHDEDDHDGDSDHDDRGGGRGGDDDASAPTLTVANVSGSEDTAIGQDIASALTDLDGSETLSVRISGMPTGAVLSVGVSNGDGVDTLIGVEGNDTLDSGIGFDVLNGGLGDAA
jgi:hypothetical protein